jgi:hypothetical protein
VVAERPSDVEEEVVRIDEEVAPARPVDVVERGDRRCDQRARPDRAAGTGDHDPESVLLAEALEDVLDARPPARGVDLEECAAQLA